jgi:hypothetical protein
MMGTAGPYTRLLCVLCLCASQVLCSALSAQEVTPHREQEAKAAFDAGVEAAKAGDYARARAHFLRSRQLLPKASTLLNLALTDLKLGLTDEALFALDAIEAPSAGSEHERLRQRARQVRSEIEAQRTSAALEPAPMTASAQAAAVASAATGIAPEAPSTPGVDVASPALAPTQTTPLQALPASTPAREPPSLLVPRVLLIVGGALAAGAVGSGLWWANRKHDADKCYRDDGSVCREKTEIDRQENAAMAMTLSLGISALAVVTSGAILLAQRKRDQRGALSAGAWGGRASFGLSVRSGF